LPLRSASRSPILLGLALACLGLVWALGSFGCGRSGQERLSLALGGAPAEIEFWESLVADFQASTGLKVELIRQPTDSDLRRQGLITPLQAGRPEPDVFLMDVAWLAQFAASGWLTPLDGFLKKTGPARDVFFEPVVDLADLHQGRLIALPINLDGGLLYYRTDLLKRSGFASPPKTWEELIRQAQKVLSGPEPEGEPLYGFAWQGAQYEGLVCCFLEFAGSNQGGLKIDNGRIGLDTPANLAALELMVDLIHKLKLSPPNTFSQMKEEEVRLLFQRGRALFERNWPYAWALHQAADSPVRGRIGLAPLPAFPGGRSVSTLGGWHVGLSVHSRAKDRAWELIRFMVSAGTQKKLALKLGWNPGRRDVYSDPEVLAAMPHLAGLREVFDHARPRPVIPYYSQLSEVLQRRLNAALAGQLSPGEALARAQEEAQAVVDRYQGG